MISVRNLSGSVEVTVAAEPDWIPKLNPAAGRLYGRFKRELAPLEVQMYVLADRSTKIVVFGSEFGYDPELRARVDDLIARGPW